MADIVFGVWSGSYLLVVKFLGLPRFEELQQVSQCPIIVMSERIAWTVPVPGHHTTKQGGRTTKGRKSDRRRETEGRTERRRENRPRRGGKREGSEEGREGGVRGKRRDRWRGDRLHNTSSKTYLIKISTNLYWLFKNWNQQIKHKKGLFKDNILNII